MPKEVTIPFCFFVLLRDMLAQAEDSSVNPAYVCGQLCEMLNDTIKKMEATENEKTV